MSRYGSGTAEVFRYYSETERDKVTGNRRLLYAELQYCIHHEMTVTAADFLLGRTGWMLYDREKAERLMHETLSLMGMFLEWDREEFGRQRSLLEKLATQVWEESYRIPDESNGSGKKRQEERRKAGEARIYA
ncbi:glycerol-3-phosphate dehydrogenase C-terminal domain-containing protein [Paenibacillus sp. DMB20]|uniref:glycerol-3-phosphate dehydrogenase C-terminal domain-containing protein n=1 Tax=Paenibacillus sp. DMB20 TaxID=1642570 RepID=UPI001F301E4E|nr:glycerol-3-phosphate dehydrogenase C-terminal domain-containing protein [Paenibacillus sp. DMB20]